MAFITKRKQQQQRANEKISPFSHRLNGVDQKKKKKKKKNQLHGTHIDTHMMAVGNARLEESCQVGDLSSLVII